MPKRSHQTTTEALLGIPARKAPEAMPVNKAQESTEANAVPEGYVIKVVPAEPPIRMQILVVKPTKDKLQKLSADTGKSMNKIINEAIVEYLAKQEK